MITAEQAANKIPNGEKEVRVFKSRILAINFILKSGKVCPFIQGRYLTNIPAEIKEIQEEVDLGHPHIYVDKNELTFDLSKTDALAGLRDRFMAEFLAMSPAERAGLMRVNPEDPNGALVAPTLVQEIAVDPTVGATGISHSDQNFKIKVASTADAAGGSNNIQGGNKPGPVGFIKASDKPASPFSLKDLQEKFGNKQGAGDSSDGSEKGNMPNSENKKSDGIAGT